MQAVNDRVIILKASVPEKTSSGFYIPQTASSDAKVKLNVGRVLSCGEGLKFSTGEFVSPVCKKGDVVMWEQFGGFSAEVLGKNVMVVRYEDILCVLDSGEYDNYVFEEK